jgi:hypothetical protein
MGDAASNKKVTTGQGRGGESIKIRENRKIGKLPHTDLCSRHAPTLIFHRERTGWAGSECAVGAMVLEVSLTMVSGSGAREHRGKAEKRGGHMVEVGTAGSLAPSSLAASGDSGIRGATSASRRWSFWRRGEEVKEDKTGHWKILDGRQRFIIFYHTGMGIVKILRTHVVMGPTVGCLLFIRGAFLLAIHLSGSNGNDFFDDVAISVRGQANPFEYIEISGGRVVVATGA